MLGVTDALVKSARDGDWKAYESLFARLREPLLYYIRLRLGPKLASKIEAGDILQETFLQAHRSFENLQGNRPGAFRAWIYRLIDNRIRDFSDHFKSQKRNSERQVQGAAKIMDQVPLQAMGPASEASQREEKERMLKGMNQLPEELRELLILRFFHGLSFRQMADQLSLKESSVRREVIKATYQLGKLMRSSEAF
jgi:RNA polymerase sigma-70 factor, ECF subfamily